MTTLTDFSFKNPNILNYFEGSNLYVPSSELIYLHSHPLIRNTFLEEIERLVHSTSEHLTKRNMKGSVVDNFISITIKLGAELPNVTQQNARSILEELRKVYTLCKSLLK